MVGKNQNRPGEDEDEFIVTFETRRTGVGNHLPNWGNTGDRERPGQLLGLDPS